MLICTFDTYVFCVYSVCILCVLLILYVRRLLNGDDQRLNCGEESPSILYGYAELSPRTRSTDPGNDAGMHA